MLNFDFVSAWRTFLIGLPLLFASQQAPALVWTDPTSLMSLVGRGDVLAAATQGGVILWDRSSGSHSIITTAHGLPTNVVVDLALNNQGDQLLVATNNGLARGWFDGPWQSIHAQPDEQGASYYSCTARPGGGWIAGGDQGQLIAWQGNRIDSLKVPTTTGRVIALDFVPISSVTKPPEPAALASAPTFPMGLVAATDNDGVWILRSTGAYVRWLQIEEIDGLPSRYVIDVESDSSGALWVATRNGIARLDDNLRVESWPQHEVLSRRATKLFWAPSEHLYLGFPNALYRIQPAVTPPLVEEIPGSFGLIVTLAWSNEGLWWGEGSQLESYLGVQIELPRVLADNYTLTSHAHQDTLWFGHPLGRLSMTTYNQWQRFDSSDGLPVADIHSLLTVEGTLYVGTGAGLFTGRRPNTTLEFEPVVGGPTGGIKAQALHSETHWAGGADGLWQRSETGWWPSALWSGASEVQSLAAAAETLWATAGWGGAAFHDDVHWVVPPSEPGLAGRYFSTVQSDNGRVVLGTNDGVVAWDGSMLRAVDGSPDTYAYAVTLWKDRIVTGTNAGLSIRLADGVWHSLGVLDALPGAKVRSLSVDCHDRLWLGCTRGVGLQLDIFDPPKRTAGSPLGIHEMTADMPGTAHVLSGKDAVHRFRFPGAPANGLDVFDVRGRRIRTLSSDDGVFSWNGLGAGGESLPNGVYFVAPAARHPSNTCLRFIVIH